MCRGFFRHAAALLLATGLSVPAAAAGPAAKQAPHAERLATATFAGGCFWCVEEAFDLVEGVLSTTSGYIGGHVRNPTYEQVVAGGTGHLEAVQVVYDPSAVSYADLLAAFWRNIDPTDAGGQFCDRGSQYAAAIFYHDSAQQAAAERSKRELEESRRFPAPLVTTILPATTFYRAEEYHQDYYRKNPIRYRFYKASCGRERRLQALWGTETSPQ